MPQYKLMLYPTRATFTPITSETLLIALKACNLISDASLRNPYLPGSAFIKLLSFLGCSPNICLTPEEGDNYCHVIFKPWQSESHCLGHTATAVPRCPQCKTKIPAWKKIAHWQNGATIYTCPHCHTATTLQKLQWKQECAYGCMAVEIINIHPFEAVPSENLLSVLQEATGVEWNYCYAEHE